MLVKRDASRRLSNSSFISALPFSIKLTYSSDLLNNLLANSVDIKVVLVLIRLLKVDIFLSCEVERC